MHALTTHAMAPQGASESHVLVGCQVVALPKHTVSKQPATINPPTTPQNPTPPRSLKLTLNHPHAAPSTNPPPLCSSSARSGLNGIEDKSAEKRGEQWRGSIRNYFSARVASGAVSIFPNKV